MHFCNLLDILSSGELEVALLVLRHRKEQMTEEEKKTIAGENLISVVKLFEETYEEEQIWISENLR